MTTRTDSDAIARAEALVARYQRVYWRDCRNAVAWQHYRRAQQQLDALCAGPAPRMLRILALREDLARLEAEGVERPVAYHGLSAYRGRTRDVEQLAARARVAGSGVEICTADMPVGSIGIVVEGPIRRAHQCDVWSETADTCRQAGIRVVTERERDGTYRVDPLAGVPIADHAAWCAHSADVAPDCYAEAWQRARRTLAVWYVHDRHAERARALAARLDLPVLRLPEGEAARICTYWPSVETPDQYEDWAA